MKKHFIGLAALSMLFLAASCTNETIESATDGDPLTFRTVLGKQTLSRATETTLTGLQGMATGTGTAIPIKSYYVGTTAVTSFHDFDLYWDADEWTYGGTPVMSPGVALRYYSWYPTTTVADGTASPTSYSLNYTVPDVATQEDLIAATATTALPSVTLTYSHLLSQVNFGIVNTLGMSIEVKNIKINGVKNKGTYTFGSGWDDLAGSPTAATYDYVPLVGTNITDGAVQGISYMGNGGGTNTHGNALMLMPQEFEDAEDGTITFDYKLSVIDVDDDNAVKYLAGTADTWASATANLCDFTSTEWLSGKRYLYLFDFSAYLGELIGEISFTVQVSNWDDAVTVAETLQVTDADAVNINAAINKHLAAKGLNPALKVFPITVTAAIGGEIQLTLPIDNSFEADDEIRIECTTAAGAAFIKLDVTMASEWELTSPTGEGKVVTLKRL